MVSDWDSPPASYCDSLIATGTAEIVDFTPELGEAHHIIISNDSDPLGDNLSMALTFQKADEGAPPKIGAPRRTFLLKAGEVLTVDGVRFRGFRHTAIVTNGDEVPFRIIAW